MGISSDMVNLAGSISAAYEERKKAAEDRIQELENLRDEVNDKLGSFEKQREKMSGELQKSRKDLLGRLHVTDKELKKSVKNLMNAFGIDHREKSVEQAKTLQEFHSALSDSVKEMRDAFEADHREKSVEQARTLQEFHSVLSNSVEKMLHVFSVDHQKMKKAQGDSLAALMNELRQSSEALRNVRKDDSGKVVSRAAKAKKRKVEPDEKVPVVAKQEEAGVIEVERSTQTVQKKAKVAAHDKGEKDEDSRELDERVLEYIISRPEGVRVGDMEKPLGANRMRLGVIAKKLYESSKVRKEDNLYLPL